uniref:Chorismate synthase n=1 Tax=Mesoaciditoga lauensis TaxID=1495039 RepID=A0A7V3RE12_9BACT
MKLLTSGDSHGYGFFAIIEGFPSHFHPDIERINERLKMRRSVYGRGERMKIEDDRVSIQSGLWEGETTGAPITFFIPNNSKSPPNDKTTIPRPGHADLDGMLKYEFDDTRVITERSSARRTVMDVAVGEFARNALEEIGIKIFGYTKAIGNVETCQSTPVELKLSDHPLVCPDFEKEKEMISKINDAYEGGYTLGGKVVLIAEGLPPGIGTFDERERRLTSILSSALYDVPSIRGVSFGDAEMISKLRGYEAVDEIHEKLVRKTNHAGGIEGGMTNGEPIVIELTVKPISTQKRGVQSIDMKDGSEVETSYVRSDTCVVAAVSIIGPDVLATALLGELLNEFGGFTFSSFKRNFELYRRNKNER